MAPLPGRMTTTKKCRPFFPIVPPVTLHYFQTQYFGSDCEKDSQRYLGDISKEDIQKLRSLRIEIHSPELDCALEDTMELVRWLKVNGAQVQHYIHGGSPHNLLRFGGLLTEQFDTLCETFCKLE